MNSQLVLLRNVLNTVYVYTSSIMALFSLNNSGLTKDDPHKYSGRNVYQQNEYEFTAY